ncbi:MFS transporter [Corynebacterium lizhenjunii]|uniref:MFS transporter n=1 Tax=Corynebacterium lizhenjunii TaxID=2709394 RepID=UPI0013E9C369|nr:MFS transporter [Corynebacterium lizhenjunii]
MSPATALIPGMGTQKSRVGILLAAIVISGITTFMFYPLIALELIARGQSPGSAGLILGFLSGTGLILSGVIGALNARLGSKALAVAGLVVRTAGLLVFAFPVDTPVYIVGAIVASLGSSANGLAIKTELMRTSASRNTITLRSIAVNLGLSTRSRVTIPQHHLQPRLVECGITPPTSTVDDS